MEGDVAVQLAKEAKDGESGVEIRIVVGDEEDSSAIARLRKEVDEGIEKWSDVVHVKRPFGSRLYDIRKTHKELTDKNISHLQTCCAYAMQQQKGDAVKLAGALRNIPAHLFGLHSGCKIMARGARQVS